MWHTVWFTEAMNSFLLQKHPWHAHYLSGTVVGARFTSGNQVDGIPALRHFLSSEVDRQDDKRTVWADSCSSLSEAAVLAVQISSLHPPGPAACLTFWPLSLFFIINKHYCVHLLFFSCLFCQNVNTRTGPASLEHISTCK